MLRARKKPSKPALALTFLLALSLVKCGDDEGGCRPGVPCHCAQGRGCVYDCPQAGCMPECHDVDFCSASCGPSCKYTCHNSADCSVRCGGGCNVECHDVSNCRASVGAQSVVTCRQLSNCDITCNGPCEVDCQGGVGACNVNCRNGTAREVRGNRIVCE